MQTIDIRIAHVPEAASVNRLVFGRYLLLSPGADQIHLGQLWSAETVESGKRVGIEFLGRGMVDDPELLEAFAREAHAALRLRHPCVTGVVDFGVDNGEPFVAMDLPEGESLAARLRWRGYLTLSEVVDLVRDAARGISAIRAHGLSACHLSPARVWLPPPGVRRNIKLSMCIAPAMRETLELLRRMTEHGRPAPPLGNGTLAYMSPEQILGGEGADQSADVWALAVMAFECLTGELPFHGTTLRERVVGICTARPRLLRLPPDARALEPWFSKALNKDPDRRFEDASAMWERLAAVTGATRALEAED